AIMKQLASKPDCCFTDILNELPIAQSTVSQHLSELKDAGLIRGSINPPKVLYCIDPENWKKAQSLFHAFLYDLNSPAKKDDCC
ncbi:MAG: helix-turn-helix domain-containing protein, partial [Bacteroidota bacterium]|nr:helix-turn-helix domain-containing protein [Bacteroidota bacterium]